MDETIFCLILLTFRSNFDLLGPSTPKNWRVIKKNTKNVIDNLLSLSNISDMVYKFKQTEPYGNPGKGTFEN